MKGGEEDEEEEGEEQSREERWGGRDLGLGCTSVTVSLFLQAAR